MIDSHPQSPPELVTIGRAAVRAHLMHRELLRELIDSGVRPQLILNDVEYFDAETLSKAASAITRRKLEQRSKRR